MARFNERYYQLYLIILRVLSKISYVPINKTNFFISIFVFPPGIREARKAYENLCLESSTSLEFHEKMIMLELVQPETLPKYVRRPYERAVLQFGTSITSLWINYIKYEMKHGDPKRASDIHERAIKTLDHRLTYSFIQEYSLIAAKSDSIK